MIRTSAPPPSPSLLASAAAAAVTPPQKVKRRKKSASSAIAADQHADEQREADVVVAHVRQLVADDALQLLAVELLEQARGDGDAGVLRIAASGEGVGRRVVDDVDAWASGMLAAIGQLPDHVHQLRRCSAR